MRYPKAKEVVFEGLDAEFIERDAGKLPERRGAMTLSQRDAPEIYERTSECLC